MSRSARIVGALMLGALVLSSCSSGDNGARRGVGVRSINTNVGLGVELEAAAPANIVVPTRAQPRQLGEPQSTIPPFDFELPPQNNKPCPVAGPFDFPAVETGVEPKGRPVRGTLPYKLDGKVSTGNGVFPVDTFDDRKITNVEDHPSIPDAYRFDVTSEFLLDARQDRGTLTTTYRVVPKPAVQNEQVPNDVGKGLFIEAITFKSKDPQGKEQTTSFNPSPAVQLIAFPVKDGTTIDSTGTDPATLASLNVTGIVKGKKQVDACGQRVDSWFVDAELTYRYSDSKTGQTETLGSNYDYGVAPQYGALIVFEHVDAPKEGPAVQIEARVGEVPKGGGG